MSRLSKLGSLVALRIAHALSAEASSTRSDRVRGATSGKPSSGTLGLIGVVLMGALLAPKPACAAAADSAPFAGSTGKVATEDSGNHPLGPRDGGDLPPTDLERVKPGDLAPDFTLEDQNGRPVTLSGFRGDRPIVLVFYRGHW